MMSAMAWRQWCNDEDLFFAHDSRTYQVITNCSYMLAYSVQ